jgi:CrcB protein
MNSYLLVFIGAGIGGSLRHAVNVGCTRFCGPAFPWGTLTVNVFGSFLMGAIAALLAAKAGEGWSQPTRLFLTTGILGGFTTFSAFPLMRCCSGSGARLDLPLPMWWLPFFSRLPG